MSMLSAAQHWAERKAPTAEKRVGVNVVGRELRYVAESRGFLSRLYRSFRAAWRCSRIAKKS